MDYKRAVLFLLKELKRKETYHDSTLELILEVIKNKNNPNEYVYKFIYDNMSDVCISDYDIIISTLGEEERL